MYVLNNVLFTDWRVVNDILIADGMLDGETLLEMPLTSDTRMFNYYPPVIQSVLEFRAIIESEYPQINALNIESENVLSNAYLTTMGEHRISQWEKVLNIVPIAGSSVDDRRETILARIRGQGKLNSELINSIVNTFTGGTANSWIKNSVLYIEITPPPTNKQYLFANVEQELKHKIPAHLNYKVSRNYFSWNEIKDNCATWQDVNDNFDNWEEVYLFVPFQ